MPNLVYPLKRGTYHRVRGFEAHKQANPGTWYGVDEGCVIGTQGYSPDKVRISNTQKISTGGGWNFRANLLNYPGIFLWFAHCSEIPTDGQIFERGQPMFKTGATGTVSGPHLHLSVLQNSVPIDPDNKNNVTWEEVDTVVTEEDKFRVAFITVQQDIAKQADINAWASSGKTPTDYVQRTFLFPIYEGFNKQIKDLNTRVVDLKKQLASQPTTGPSEIDVSKLKRINFTYK